MNYTGKPIPATVVEFVKQRREALVAERQRLTAPIDQQIAELDEFLGVAHGQTTPADDPQGAESGVSDTADSKGRAAARAANQRIVDEAAKLLARGEILTSPTLYLAMRDAGVPIDHPKPVRKVIQVLSNSPLFAGLRGHGWYLKAARPDLKEEAPESSKETEASA
jgi:hypothetical protein